MHVAHKKHLINIACNSDRNIFNRYNKDDTMNVKEL